MKTYNYLIAYIFADGIGTTIISINRKIDSANTINGIRDFIEKESKLNNVGILSFQLINVERKRSKTKCRKQNVVCVEN